MYGILYTIYFIQYTVYSIQYSIESISTSVLLNVFWQYVTLCWITDDTLLMINAGAAEEFNPTNTFVTIHACWGAHIHGGKRKVSNIYCELLLNLILQPIFLLYLPESLPIKGKRRKIRLVTTDMQFLPKEKENSTITILKSLHKDGKQSYHLLHGSLTLRSNLLAKNWESAWVITSRLFTTQRKFYNAPSKYWQYLCK